MGKRWRIASPSPGFWASIGLLAVVGLLGSGRAQADPPRALEYELKAVFLQKLVHFVEWPDSAFADSSAAFVIAVVGEDPFGPALDVAFEGQKVDGRDVVIERHERWETLTEPNLLFVSRSEKAHLCDILEPLGDRPALTVSDFEGFCRRGGTLALSMSGKRVSLAVNVEGCRRTGLMISARLLRLATEVEAADCEAG